MIEPATFNTLRRFPAGGYDRFGARRGAPFEVLGAAPGAGLVPSLGYLCFAPGHRRRWGSLYDALAAGSMQATALRELVARYPWMTGNLSMLWTPASGRAMMPRPARHAGITSPPPVIRPANRS